MIKYFKYVSRSVWLTLTTGSDVPKWSTLAAFGDNRLLRSSYVWLIVVPVIARLFDGIGSPIILTGISQELKINLELPFSWKIFFFAAVAISFANSVFAIYRPNIVKLRDFGKFQQKGYTITYLVWEFMMATLQRDLTRMLGEFLFRQDDPEPKGEKPDFDKKYVRKLDIIPTEIISHPTYALDGKAIVDDGKVGELFWAMYDEANHSGLAARIVCFVMFAIGFLSILYVMAENILYVWLV